MDIHHEHRGTLFVWNAVKAATNIRKHGGIRFEQAVEVFFDPLFRLVDAGRNEEARDAVIGFDAAGRVLFVVHVQVADDHIRIISARRATAQERKDHDF
jgi:uncharacterized DUF497 family protein